MVEQGTENPRVGGSILSLGTRESKGLQRKLQAFFRYGLLPDARLRIAARGHLPSGGPSRSSSFFPRFFLRPVFGPVRGIVPGVTGGFPMPIRAFIRTGCAMEQHAACAYPDNHAQLPCAVAACPLSRPSRKEKSGKETSAPSRFLWQVFGAWPGSQPGVRQGTCLPRQRPARSLLPPSGAADRVRHWGRRPHAGAFLRPG